MGVYFKPGIGELLWESGISLEQYLENLKWEENIDISGLTGKAKCVFEKLKDLTLFKETIGKFENNNSYDLIFSYSGICSGGVGEEACTDAEDLSTGSIKIKILGTTDVNLDFAATLLHEGIHAAIYKYVDENEGDIDPNDRPNLFAHYNFYKAKNADDKGTTYAQHEHMQDAYVVPIAKAIRKLDGYRYPLEDYYGFGWEGLKVYNYDKYYDANRILKTMTPEQYNALIRKKDEIAGSSSFAQSCN